MPRDKKKFSKGAIIGVAGVAGVAGGVFANYLMSCDRKLKTWIALLKKKHPSGLVFWYHYLTALRDGNATLQTMYWQKLYESLPTSMIKPFHELETCIAKNPDFLIQCIANLKK
jgi:hypothetical protein